MSTSWSRHLLRLLHGPSSLLPPAPPTTPPAALPMPLPLPPPALAQKALAIKSAIPHPRIMGVIRECGGKMHMHERSWAEAATDFFEAFKSYDEVGGAGRATGRCSACVFVRCVFVCGAGCWLWGWPWGNVPDGVVSLPGCATQRNAPARPPPPSPLLTIPLPGSARPCPPLLHPRMQAGSGRRVQCLKYLVLANMLMESKVDPFDSQEARPYKSDPEVGGCSGWVQWVFVDGKAGQWLLPCLGTCAFAPVP